MSSFGDRLREARAAAGLTQEQLGTAVGVTNSAVSAWENGRDVPSFGALLKIRDAVGASLDMLVCGERGGSRALHVVRDGSPSQPYYTDAARATTAREQAMLQRFRALSPKRQAAFLELLKPDG